MILHKNASGNLPRNKNNILPHNKQTETFRPNKGRHKIKYKEFLCLVEWISSVSINLPLSFIYEMNIFEALKVMKFFLKKPQLSALQCVTILNILPVISCSN